MSALLLQPNVERYRASFEQFESSQNASPWLSGVRRGAIKRFLELGFPTVREEDWKYTDIGAAASLSASPVHCAPTNGDAPRLPGQLPLSGLEGHHLVWVDGHFRADLGTPIADLPAEIECSSLSEAFASHSEVVQEHFGRYADSHSESLVALNTAFASDGAFVRIPAGCQVEKPILLIYVASCGPEKVVYPRNLILLGSGSSVHLVEAYVSVCDGTYFSNGVTEIAVGQNAQLEHIKLQLESENAYHVGAQFLVAARDSVVSSSSLNFGGLLVRNGTTAVLGDDNATITLNGLVVADGNQHVDNHTTMDHARPNCASHELYAHVLDGHATGVFNGKIFVREDAQKTDAKQSNRTLLLSRDAQINSKPQLEIFADDVKCTHGATIGQLDDDALFYLRARGVPLEEARNILVHAFAAEIWDNISIGSLRSELEAQLLARLI